MRVFIAGTRSLETLDNPVQKKMQKISQKGYDILVGDWQVQAVKASTKLRDLNFINKKTLQWLTKQIAGS